MTKIKILFVIGTLLFYFGISYGQKATKEVILYKTIEDLKNGHGENIGILSGYSSAFGHLSIRTENGHKGSWLDDYWGFSIDSSLYRVSKTDIVKVISVGHIVYYENGFAYLRMIINDSNTGWVSNEKVYFYSKTLTSEISWSLKKLIKSLDNPDDSTLKVINGLEEAYKTKGWDKQINAVRKCIMEFN